MSKQIDERVVSMQFDNANFEKNAQTSLNTLDKLKQALNFDGIGKGLSDLGNVSEAVAGFSGFGNTVDNVKSKFSALETVAVGALLKIGSQAVEAGERMVKSLTIDNVTAGFTKYADKTTSVQTIMAATADQFSDTGKQMEYVSEQLEKLNWFTDETSYNFVDMTNNIGKFTSQGIGLEDSVTAMEGIAVWAAQSGQNAEAASRAMYNLSQALGVGAVKLQDWKSIENANMATKEFKEIAIAAGIASGAIKEGQVTVENFGNSLSDKATKGWFNKEVLMTVLKQYGTFTDVLKETMSVYEDAGATTSEMLGYMEEYKNGTLDAQSVAEQYGVTVEKLTSDLEKLGSAEFELGRKSFKSAQEAKTFEEAIDATKDAVSTAWLNIFETIFGNYLEAKELWTDLANYLYDVFATPVNDLGDLLSEWASENGRDALIEGFRSIADAFDTVLGTIKEGWRDVFPKMDGKQLANLTKKFADFAKKLKPSEKTLEKLKTILSGVFSILSLGIKTIKAVVNALKPVGNAVKNVTDRILDLGVNISKFFIELNKSTKYTDVLNKGMEAVKKTFTDIIDGFKNYIDTIRIAYEETGKVGQAIKTAIDGVIDKIKSMLLHITEVIEKVTGLDLSNISNKISDIFDNLKAAVDNFDWDNFFNIEKAIDTFKSRIKDAFGQIGVWYDEAGGGAAGVANVIFNGIASAIEAIITKFEEITGIDLSGFMDKLIDSIDKAKVAVQDFLKKFEKIDETNKKLSLTQTLMEGICGVIQTTFGAIIDVIKGIGEAIAKSPLLAALTVFGFTDIKSFITSITNLADSLSKLVEQGKLLEQISGSFNTAAESVKDAMNKMTKDILVNDVLKIAIALGILVTAMMLMTQIPVDKLALVFGAITGLFGELMGSMAIMSKIPNFSFLSRSLGMEMIKVAAAVLIMAKAVEVLLDANPLQLATAVIALYFAMGFLVSMVDTLYHMTTMLTKSQILEMGGIAVVMIVLAVAVKKLADAMATIAAIGDISHIAAGLVVVVAGLAMLAYTANYINNTLSMSTAVTLVALAAGMWILADAIIKLASIDFLQLMTGLFGVIGGLTALVIAINIVQSSVPITAAIGLLAMAEAVKILSDSIVALNSIDIGTMLVSMLSLTTMLVVMMAVMQNLGPGTVVAAVGMLILADAIQILANAFMTLNNADPDALCNSVIALGVAVAGLVVALKFMQANLVGAAAFVIAAAGVSILADAIRQLQNVNFDNTAEGIAILVTVMAALVVACKAMNECLIGAAAMLIVSAAILGLSFALQLLTTVPIEAAAEGLFAIAVAIGGFALAATTLSSIIPILLMFATALAGILALVGLGLGALGLGLMAIGTGISMIAVSGAAASEAISLLAQALAPNLATFSQAVGVFVPLTAALVAFSVSALAAGVGAIVLGAGLIVLALGIGLLGAASALLDLFGTSLDTLGTQIVSFVTQLALFAGPCVAVAVAITTLTVAMVTWTVASIALDAALVLLAASVGLLYVAMDGLALVVNNCGDGVLKIGEAFQLMADYGPAAAEALVTTAAALLGAAPDIAKAGEEMQPLADAIADLTTYLDELNAALLLSLTQFTLITTTALMMTASITAAQLAFTLFVNTLNSFEESSLTAFDKVNIAFGVFCVAFLTSISNYGQRIKNTARTLAREIVNDGFKYYLNLSQGRALGQNFMIGIANGLKDKESYATGRAKQVGNAINKTMADTLKVKSPSRIGVWLGQMYDVGIGNGLEKFVNRATVPALGVANSITSSMQQALSTVNSMFDYDLSTEPVITPVIDITDAKKTLGNLNDMMNLDSVNSLALGFDANQARAMNASYEQQDFENRLFDKLIKAVTDSSNKETPVNINVDVVQDDQGTFNVTANQNDMYKKRYGKTRFA